MASRTLAKRKGKDFSVSEKVQLIDYKKENPKASVRVIADKFDCGKSQISIYFFFLMDGWTDSTLKVKLFVVRQEVLVKKLKHLGKMR